MSQDLFSFSSDSVDDPASISSTPVVSSGISEGSSPAAPVVSLDPVLGVPALAVAKPSTSKGVNPSPATNYICKHCSKTYVRKWYYDRHVIAHEISDVTASRPNAVQFHIVIEDLMQKVVEKLKTEHDLGEDSIMKKEFLESISENKLKDPLWCDFLKSLEEPLLEFLTHPSKLLPQNKYEEALKKLNYYLGDQEHMREYLNHLKNLAPDFFPLFECLARRLIYRIAFLLLEELQVFIAREMQQSATPSAVVVEVQSALSAGESDGFYSVLGNLLRSLYTRAYKLKSSSKMFKSMCTCLREKFVYYNGGDEQITTKQFTDKHLWLVPDEYANHEGIIIQREVVNFFLFVEDSISLENNVFTSIEDLMAKIYSNRELMSVWCGLTQSYFGDANAVCVMKKVVAAFRELSILNEMNRKNRQHAEHKVALRTNLKRD